MAGMHVLVVDDDPKIRLLLRRCLEGEGFSIDEAADRAGVQAAFARSVPDLVTLDLCLGSENGLDVARDIRRSHAVPMIMITGKDDVIDRIVGLELGADDYITKPFHVREMLARVRSVLRRSDGRADAGPKVSGRRLVLDGLTIDLDGMCMADRNGVDCGLTTGEFNLLCAFVEHAGRPLSRDRLMDLTHGTQWSPLDRTIDNQVARLRKKVERDPANPVLIKTVRGLGYALTLGAVPP